MVTRRVLLDIPRFIEEFVVALYHEDYQECAELKETLLRTYNSFDGKLQEGTRQYVDEYLSENCLDNTKDLNGVFDEILGS